MAVPIVPAITARRRCDPCSWSGSRVSLGDKCAIVVSLPWARVGYFAYFAGAQRY
jgi:hypothetical protein